MGSGEEFFGFSAADVTPPSWSRLARYQEDKELLVARPLQWHWIMRVVAVAMVIIAGCTESVKERFDRLQAAADTTCWHHWCTGGPGSTFYPPEIPVEQGVACMNDALASGARAMAWWGADSPSTGYDGHGTYYFTVDHQVEVFTSHQEGPRPFEFDESPSCAGPFVIGPEFCAAFDPNAPGSFVSVKRIAVEGCL